jgi:D-alanine-D-alanine ligase
MRICILSDETIEEFNPSKYFHAYEWDLVTVEPPVDELVHKLVSLGKYDIYLNIFEGMDENEDGFLMVQTLERLNLAFTGADTAFYNPTREQMQEVAEKNDINFARGFRAATETDLEQAGKLRFPLIVKHPNSYASTGLTPASRVDTFDQLREQFIRNHVEFGSARIEEFIEGREVTCLVVDNPEDLSNPYAYPPAEVKFPDGESFLHVEVKWLNWGTFFVPLEDTDLVKRVQEVSREMYLAMKGTGYGRVDIRVRPNGELVVLEINPNCGILYYGEDDRGPADLPISWDKDRHDGFLDRIFRSALLRQQMRQ